MTKVLKFPDRGRAEPHGWPADELQQIVAACSGSVAKGEASGWETGLTDLGDPQVYLIGPAPDYDCILCISRIGRRFVIEDGEGRVLMEQDSPMLLAEQALSALRQRKSLLLAKVAIVWQAFRETVSEKAEVLTEPMQALAHLAPQLSALA